METKLGENDYVQTIFRSERIGSPTVYWNGISVTTTSGTSIDGGPYEDALFILNYGSVLGQRASLLNSVYEGDNDDPSLSMAITSASFTTVSSSTTEATQLASLKAGDKKRHLWLRTEVQNAYSATEAATIDFSAQVVLGGSYKQPVDNTLVFDV